MLNKKLIRIFCLIVSLSVVLVGMQIPAQASAVAISQNGNVVTATNGNYTITYDLSTGRGNLSYGSTALISNFYSDFAIDGQSSRIYSYDAGTRKADWTAIGNSGYGSGGIQTHNNM